MLWGVHHHCLNPGLWAPCGQGTRCPAEPEASGAEPPPPHSWPQTDLFLEADVACGQRRVGLRQDMPWEGGGGGELHLPPLIFRVSASCWVGSAGQLRDLCLGWAGRLLEPKETQMVTRVAQHMMAAAGRAPLSGGSSLKGLVGALPKRPSGPPEGVLLHVAFGACFLEVGASEPAAVNY